jgi:hypothetical protein
MDNKVKNFDEYQKVSEGMFAHADWIDLSLLQNTIERMRNDDYKIALEELNSKFPMNSNVKINLPGSED